MTRYIVLCITVLMPSVLQAQNVETLWPGLNPAIFPVVYILDGTGVETAGRLLRLESNAVVILVGEAERRFAMAQVQRIQIRGDSLKNGAIRGAVVGAVVGVLGALMADCPGDNPGGACLGSRLSLLAFSTGMFTAVGTGIDAHFTRRTTVYEAPKSEQYMNREPPVSQPSPAAVMFTLKFHW